MKRNRTAKAKLNGKRDGRKIGKRLNRIIGVVGIALVAASITQELRKPIDKRTWEGRVMGVPYDYRKPSLARMRSTWWAPEDSRVLVPTAFGMGWDLNVGRMVRLASNVRGNGRS